MDVNTAETGRTGQYEYTHFIRQESQYIETVRCSRCEGGDIPESIVHYRQKPIDSIYNDQRNVYSSFSRRDAKNPGGV